MAEQENELYCGLGYSGKENIIGIEVLKVLPNSAAEAIGLQPQDTIIAVQESSFDKWRMTGNMTPKEDRGNTRGIAGSQIRLQVLRPREGQTSETFETDWVRREVIITDIDAEVTLDSSHECGLIGSLTPMHTPFANASLTHEVV